MKISGFTMSRNASKLYYPLKESILSILPIVDEMIVALGKGDDDDDSRELIESIGSPKIKIVNTEWNTIKFPGGMELARQTDIAKSHCTGDWLIYIQSDELIHEKDHTEIIENCKKYLNEPLVEGFLFNYIHFWGDYNHLQDSHSWYRRDIRIIRNNTEIHSWRDAQSFRKIPNFDGESYMQLEDTYKLNVIQLKAHIYHYGWVRPPEYMTNKVKAFQETKYGKKNVKYIEDNQLLELEYDYGLINRLTSFKGAHPKLMETWIKNMNWKHKLRTSGPFTLNKMPIKQNLLKYRVISFIEKYLLFGARLGEFKNYNIVKPKLKE